MCDMNNLKRRGQAHNPNEHWILISKTQPKPGWQGWIGDWKAKWCYVKMDEQKHAEYSKMPMSTREFGSCRWNQKINEWCVLQLLRGFIPKGPNHQVKGLYFKLRGRSTGTYPKYKKGRNTIHKALDSWWSCFPRPLFLLPLSMAIASVGAPIWLKLLPLFIFLLAFCKLGHKW